MRYMLLIYSDPASYQDMSQAGQGAVSQEYLGVSQEMDERGVRESGESLEPVHTATTLRIRGDRMQMTDGPYADTQEHLAGYYILNCKNLDEALEFAGKIPAARRGAIEIRPIGQAQMPC